jgi:hypothetical protein
MIRVAILVSALVVLLGCDSLSDIQEEADDKFRPKLEVNTDTIGVNGRLSIPIDSLAIKNNNNNGDTPSGKEKSGEENGDLYYDEVKIRTKGFPKVAPGESEEVPGYKVRLNEKEDTPGADVLIIEAMDAVAPMIMDIVFWYEQPGSDKKYYGHHKLSIEVDR